MNFNELTHLEDFRGEQYLWPNLDKKLKQVNDWVDDVSVLIGVFEELKRPMLTAIQAGGACGLWPLRLAQHFQLVVSYEVHPVNYYCMVENIRARNISNIVYRNVALGADVGIVHPVLDQSEIGNAGAYYTIDGLSHNGPSFPRIKLDNDMKLFNVDLIQFDLEGREVEALQGAEVTIDRWRPIIMIEEKPLPQMGKGQDIPHNVGDATKWLKAKGYQKVAEVHRDVILAPLESL